jgi:DNA-binding transcriptional regulator YiaG
MNIAKEIRTAREKLGLTQTQCAKLLDISPRKLWAWEDGSAKPSRIEQYGILPLLESKARPKQEAAR